MRFRSCAATHEGAVRKHNEDRFVDRPEIGLWAVADGAGGHHAGEVASGMIADLLYAIPEDLPPSIMLAEVRARVGRAHEALREEAARRGPDTIIASTVAVLLAKDVHFACLWAGDSRVYLLRDGELTQITRDHSFVQELVDAGLIRADEAESHPRANIITRAVGAGDEGLALDKVSGQLQPGDRFLLCSDGLTKTLSVEEIAALLAVPDPEAPPESLVAAALARRVTDNVTVVAVDAVE